MSSRRVILRLREDDFLPSITYREVVACVKSYLILAQRPAEEADQGKHFWHFQPPNGKPGTNPRFHIIIDIDRIGHSGPLPKDFPHEMYNVTKVDNEIQLKPISYKNKHVHDNFLRKVRHFSDDFYLWGQDPVLEIDPGN